MAADILTLAANLEHAARTQKAANIGGGVFSPQECADLAALIRAGFGDSGRAAFCVPVAGYPVALYRTGRGVYRVTYGADIRDGLSHDKAAETLGHSIMHGLALMGRIDY